MVARVREAPPATVLAATAVGIAMFWFAVSMVSVMADAPLVMAGPALGVVLSLAVFFALQTGAVWGLSFSWTVAVAMLPLSFVGISFGGFAMFPTAVLLVCACTTAAPGISAAASRVAALLGLAGLAAIGVYAGVIAFGHAGDELYGAPEWGTSLVLGLVGCAVVGAGLGVWSGRPALAVTVATGTAFLLFIVFMSLLFAFPLLALPLLAFAFVVARRPGERGAAIFGGGLLLGVAVPVLAVLALQSPLADCRNGDSGGNVWVDPPGLDLFGGSISSVGGGSVSAGGEERYRSSGDGWAVSYACRGDRVTDFRLSR